MELIEVFPLGEHLKEELISRGWTSQTLADRCNLPVERIWQILEVPRDTVFLMKEMEALAYGLDVSAVALLNIQLAWLKRQEK
jgi:plasmid maintenance system antidote protein VapI